jgi:hypothetical protein
MEMRNLRQRLGALVVAAAMGVMMVATAATTHASGLSGPGADACAFISGVAMKIPGGVPGQQVLLTVLTTLFGC